MTRRKLLLPSKAENQARARYARQKKAWYRTASRMRAAGHDPWTWEWVRLADADLRQRGEVTSPDNRWAWLEAYLTSKGV